MAAAAKGKAKAKPAAEHKASAKAKAPARRKTAAKPADTPAPPAPATAPLAAPLGWVPADAPLTPAKAAPKPFDPATGAWLPAEAASPALAASPVDPAAPARRPIATLMLVVLVLDLLGLAFLLLSNLFAGATLLFAPDSAAAQEIEKQFQDTTPLGIALQSLTSLVMLGAIPFLWVLASRAKPWAGTRTYLRLNGRWADLGKGVLLTIPVLLGVMLLLSIYILATEGTDGFTSEPGDNPAVESIVDNLSLPLAFLVALCAGVGEELFFRGLLQRRIGVWGQAAVFGLAHAAGGYIPQIVLAAGIGVLFGLLVQRGWPLWAVMATHFLYDFILLSSALLFPDFG